MRLTIEEFFFLLREKLRLSGRSAKCGDVYLKEKKRKGKEPLQLLTMRYEGQPLERYGGRIPPESHEVTIPFDKFEYFACRLFTGTEFEMDLSLPADDESGEE